MRGLMLSAQPVKGIFTVILILLSDGYVNCWTSVYIKLNRYFGYVNRYCNDNYVPNKFYTNAAEMVMIILYVSLLGTGYYSEFRS